MSWIDENASRVSRDIFTNVNIHGLEIERIFNRSWLYLGHESEIPKPGDYVTRPMGGDQVIVSRGDDGKVRVFLNSCRHRGMLVARADAGTTRHFVCAYHAWTYDTTGALRTTSFDQHHENTDLSQLGLIQVPRLDSYGGLIFGNWDVRACSLDEHLGDAKWYLDILFARTPGGMSVLGPPQRWVIETNWKIPALNFMDTQHALTVHKGPMTMGQDAGAPPLAVIAKMADVTPQLSFPQGHGITVAPAMPEGMPEFLGYPQELIPLYQRTLSAAQFSQFRNGDPGIGTLFPNISWIERALAVAPNMPPTTFLNLRNWQPLGPNKIEVWSWYFADTEASADWRAESHRIALQTFGIGGIFDEDDAEIWAAISRALQGPVASRQFMDFSAGRKTPPLETYSGPGVAYPSLLSEHAQFGFLKRWNHLMQQGDAK